MSRLTLEWKWHPVVESSDKKKYEQAGAELGQAQQRLKLILGWKFFTMVNIDKFDEKNHCVEIVI